MRNITILYDYTTSDCISYEEGRHRKYGFVTNCLQFFTFKDNAQILCRDGKYISSQELLENTGEYTDRYVRKEHNILKMFIAGAFSWKED